MNEVEFSVMNSKLKKFGPNMQKLAALAAARRTRDVARATGVGLLAHISNADNVIADMHYGVDFAIAGVAAVRRAPADNAYWNSTDEEIAAEVLRHLAERKAA